MDAFDADVLIYAAVPGHPLGERVAALLSGRPAIAPGRAGTADLAGIGSVLLVPEVLSKPLRDGETAAVNALSRLLARLDLRPVDRATGLLAAVLGARYGLRAADAIHLATAVSMGAERFITNNRRDFPVSVKEIDVTYPDALPARQAADLTGCPLTGSVPDPPAPVSTTTFDPRRDINPPPASVSLKGKASGRSLRWLGGQHGGAC